MHVLPIKMLLGVATSTQQQNDAQYFIDRIDKEVIWGSQVTDNFEKANYSYSQGDYRTAAQVFFDITQSTPQWLEPHYWLGRSYCRIRRAF